MEDLQLKGPHWSFAIDLYGRPGVADACLWLQDVFDVDVNVVLLVLFAASERGIALAPSDIPALDRAVAEWRSEIVVALRSIRRRLKAGPPPAPSAETEALRDAVKGAELRAEQIEQAVLASWIEQKAPGARSQPVNAGEVLRSAVELFAARSQIHVDPAIRLKADAAMETILVQLTTVAANRSIQPSA